MRRLRSERRDRERGAVLAEYPIVLAVLTLAGFAGLTALTDVARNDYSETGNSIGTAVTYPTTTSTSTTLPPPPPPPTSSTSTTAPASTTSTTSTSTTTTTPRPTTTTSSTTTTTTTTLPILES